MDVGPPKDSCQNAIESLKGKIEKSYRKQEKYKLTHFTFDGG
jgi:hypothetical protein